jgi:ribosome biogenesis GTPase
MVSALTGEGMDSLEVGFDSGSTVAFTGRSGVGKSSLINRLLRRADMKTGEVRGKDLRGRHTTTHKELFFLRGGAMVIDTPGMRELQLWGDEESLEETYGEIYEAAKRCRFADCSHQNEPGCAVQKLLVEGSLDIGRYENYLDMRAELRFLESKISEKKRHERKGREKELSKLIRKFKKNR